MMLGTNTRAKRAQIVSPQLQRILRPAGAFALETRRSALHRCGTDPLRTIGFAL